MKNQGFNTFVGSASGVLKGIQIIEKRDLYVKNLDSLKTATNKNPITCMNWGETTDEVVVGYGNQLIKVYNVKSKAFTFQEEKKCGAGSLVGLAKFSGAMMTGVDGGTVKLWRQGGETTVIETGSHLERVKHNTANPQFIATGGKENDLKIWDVNTGQATFVAKNVRHDNLELREQVWITDIGIFQSSNKIAVTARFGHVRLYDPNTPQRRPVVSAQVPEQSLTCLSTCCKDYHVIVGSGAGQMNLVDLRSKGLVMNKYKGFLGGVKSIGCSMDEPYIASVSLDRHFRVHHLTTKELLFKEYMQSKLTCVLVHPNMDIKQKDATSSDEEELPNSPKREDPFEKDDTPEKIKEEEPPAPPTPVAEKRSRNTGGSGKKKHKSAS